MSRFAHLFLLAGVLALGQVGTSTITGRVTDSTGAIIPGVAVTIVQTQTNFTFNAVTAVDFQNPRTFGKVTGDITATAIGAQPLMHLTVALSW